MSEIRPLSISQFEQAYASGASARQVLTPIWQRLNALGCGPCGDSAFIAIANIEQLDAQLSAIESRVGDDLPLYGIPFVVKDNINVAGWPTTAGLPSRNARVSRSAHVVELLQRAGAVLLAKTNLDQFATGLVGTRSPFGAVPNPFSEAHISGGSSSGSASAVARGLACFALGTDTAGSGRVPAAFCNLVGFKPTPGLVSTTGVLPACASIDCVSIFALVAEDAARVLQVIANPGERPADELCFHAPVVERLAFGRSLRVGVASNPEIDDLDARPLYEQALARLRSLGHQVVVIDISPLDDAAALLYEGPWVAERYAVAGAAIETADPGLDSTVVRVIGRARAFSATQAFEGLYALKAAQARARLIWQSVDLIMLPTAPRLPRRAEVEADPVGCNARLGRYTNSVNLLGWAAVAMPAGFTPEGLPWGVSFIAPGGCDAALLDWATSWEQGLESPVGAGLGPRTAASAQLSFEFPDRLAGERVLPIAVVGAHLVGMPLHHQVVAAGARLLARTRTAARYRLYALSGGPPHRPALKRVVGAGPAGGAGAESHPRGGGQVGASIEVEVYGFPIHAVGAFLADIAPPLGLGRIELQDGRWVQGFICEPWGLVDAQDITASGGWRYHLKVEAPEAPSARLPQSGA